MPKEECGVTDKRIQEATRCWEDPVPEAESPENCENKPFPSILFILAKGKEYNRGHRWEVVGQIQLARLSCLKNMLV